jgi:hypothetical protein
VPKINKSQKKSDVKHRAFVHKSKKSMIFWPNFCHLYNTTFGVCCENWGFYNIICFCKLLWESAGDWPMGEQGE